MAVAEPKTFRRSLSSQAAEALRSQIEAGYYAPGDKLPTEPALVGRFGFSRTVIREAIAALRADGLVESRQGAGVFVLGPSQSDGGLKLFTGRTCKISDIIEELEFRIGIEVEAAGLAALRSSPAQEAEIQAQVDRFAALASQNLPTDDADFQFHMAIAAASNNGRFRAFLEHVGRRMIPRVKFRSAMGGVEPLPNRDEPILDEHREIGEAILVRDPDRAREAMRRHLVTGIERYRALRNSRDDGGGALKG
ncbi:FadR/GntR family transcriptional regulator [Rhizobium sp. LC145]|jgi:GntR family transcriptional regulator, transcriptional repressor for pyruvate dehydrogenase complex|uniref:FadR/GntR family transcriptional regulator n=1 Tax=Rhizobium sp. LC145 TaxID=1120688 RepID=UPI00062A3A07|nr:FadR/GntR family transcriptional regulator [Rhizobium sp. LC145]KKX27058.1 GntR family transcriptional regulator [Rhizobium sp. LC145]TKT56629.1 FadR family transcriptional regulator [Rhizobiaceae bacterium LC148]